MIISFRGIAGKEIVVSEEVRGKALVAPLMVKLNRVPERDEGKQVVGLRGFEMQMNGEIAVEMTCLQAAGAENFTVRRDFDAFERKGGRGLL